MAMGRPMLKAVKTRLGKEVRRARKEKRLTLEKVAAATGLPLSTIRAIEAGEIRLPSPDKLRKIAEALEPETDFALLSVLAYQEEPRPVPA